MTLSKALPIKSHTFSFCYNSITERKKTHRKKEDTQTEWQKTDRERKKGRDKKENEKEKEGTKRSKRDRERDVKNQITLKDRKSLYK